MAVLFLEPPFFITMIDKIEFVFLGMNLLEPMAMVTNLFVIFVCVYGYKMSKHKNTKYWNLFFALFALASFFGGLSHLFWNYWGFYGKILPWLLGVAATSFLTYAMVRLFGFSAQTERKLVILLILKAVVLLLLAFWNWNFLFVAIDTIFSLVLACGIGGWILFYTKKSENVKYILQGVLAMLPAAFIFLFKFDAHDWLNREDLSHILIAMGLLFFVSFTKKVALDQVS